MSKRTPRTRLTHYRFTWRCGNCGRLFTEEHHKHHEGLDWLRAALRKDLWFCGCSEPPPIICDKVEETVGPPPQRERVWRGDSGLRGRTEYYLHLHCPSGCGGHLDFSRGNMMAGSQPVPGIPELRYEWGGPWYEYSCDTCRQSYNWDKIPDECWDVEMCLPEPVQYGPKLPPDWPTSGITIMLRGPRRRRVL